MYYQVIAQCTQSLKNLEICLDKAERYAAAKKFDIGVLLSSRLAPDMQAFTYQLQSACDYVKAGAAWLVSSASAQKGEPRVWGPDGARGTKVKTHLKQHSLLRLRGTLLARRAAGPLI